MTSSVKIAWNKGESESDAYEDILAVGCCLTLDCEMISLRALLYDDSIDCAWQYTIYGT